MSAVFEGVDAAEAARLLGEFGPNEIALARRRTLLRIVFETMREPMFFLLMGAAVLYLALGDLGEGLFLVAGAAAAIGLVIFQEARSERALAALRELAQPQVRVIRSGVETRIAARDLVPGDIVLIGEGERLPADAALVGGEVLTVDEAALTGESAPVIRTPSPVAESATAASALLGGSLVVRGQGIVQVTQTGARSAMGKIGSSLAAIPHELTPLQKTASRLVSLLGVFALGFCGLVVIAYGLLRHDWIEAVLAGITIAISLIPEEFPMVLAVFLALGAWRLARHRVLVRRSAVIETLGAATVLCVDKTGTLTENQMRVERIWTPQTEWRSGDRETVPTELMNAAVRASGLRPVDPMDKAIRALAESNRLTASASESAPERAWPLTPERLAVIQLWTVDDVGALAAAKGAPEAIFALCHLPDGEVRRFHQVVGRYAEDGLRVLGVAQSQPERSSEEPEDWQFEFLGLIGFVDPLRNEVPGALAEARSAGIKVLMMTGDYPATALAIARQAGIDASAGVLTGGEIAELSFDELCKRLTKVRVFARIFPEQKLRIVEALKADGELVAMTGDGVNDAPALEAAHIGMAMGRKGTDVAREASDLVLLDDSFASIIGGVRLGRRIFSNLRRALTYVTAIHVPIAGLALAPILIGLPPLLLPMHVVLLELVIDPMCALVFEVEPSDARAMERPPRRRDEPLFGVRQIAFALLQGLSIMAAVLGVHALALQRPAGVTAARGAGFVALIVGVLVLGLADSMSSTRVFAVHRRIYWGIAGAVAAIMVAVFAVPALSSIFEVSRPEPLILTGAIAAGSMSAAWAQLSRLRKWSV